MNTTIPIKAVVTAGAKGALRLGRAALAGLKGIVKAEAAHAVESAGAKGAIEAVGVAKGVLEGAAAKEAATGLAKPAVADAKLGGLIDDLYRPNATVGTGSTADAIRHTMSTGELVGGSDHLQKGGDYCRALTKWLDQNPGASTADRAAAQSVLQDLRSAMGGH